MQATDKIWMNGELVDWDDARVHVGAHGLHYGTGVFEGVRCYDTPAGPAVFRGADHMQRLHDSAQLIGMEIPFSVDELRAATNDLISANGLRECYIRPIAFYGFKELGVSARGNPVETVIMTWPWGTYLGEEALKSGIRTKVSSWQRMPPNVIPHASKATGVYLNSMLAVQRGAERRLRRGDHAHARGHRRRRAGRDDLRGQEGHDLHARPLDRDPARDHARLDHPDRSRPRLHGAREDADPLRPLPRRRGVHVRHRRRGDARAVGRRPRDRRRRRHARAPEGVSRHRARRQRPLVAVARGRARARRARAA